MRSDIESIELFHGKNSKEYSIGLRLDNARKLIKTNKFLSIIKKCSMENIRFVFMYDECTNSVYKQSKSHHDKENDKIRTVKEKDVQISLNDFIDYLLYELLCKGYEVEEFK